ncbi:UNVERIFIED_CONTAM: hypothetical protein PYX00_005401 [Menopon gallinae]|uniref:Uncharacterized protein n=1 Tax=Menopon gallinae TaxID=328185 RepID=A0AAW2HR52_9NEOP
MNGSTDPVEEVAGGGIRDCACADGEAPRAVRGQISRIQRLVADPEASRIDNKEGQKPCDHFWKLFRAERPISGVEKEERKK